MKFSSYCQRSTLCKYTCYCDLLFQCWLWKDWCYLCYWLYVDVAKRWGEFLSTGTCHFLNLATFRLRNCLVLQNIYLHHSSFLEYSLVDLLCQMINLVPNLVVSKCGPQTRSFSITRELVRNAKFGAPRQMNWAETLGGGGQGRPSKLSRCFWREVVLRTTALNHNYPSFSHAPLADELNLLQILCSNL